MHHYTVSTFTTDSNEIAFPYSELYITENYSFWRILFLSKF